MTLPFSDERLRDALWPRPFRFFPRAGSTNDLAAIWAAEGAPSGAVVVTDEQLTGRGRFDRTWFAPPATGLLFSVVLRPHVTAEQITRITMLGAVSIVDALDDLFPGLVSVKWPNDIQVGGRKLAGILTEASWQERQLRWVILGIGLNISIDFQNTPLAQQAVSLSELTLRPIDRGALLASILRRMDFWIPRMGLPDLPERWRATLNTLGQTVTVTFADGQTITGRASDVEPDGALQLIDEIGTLHRVLAGEVSLRAKA